MASHPEETKAISLALRPEAWIFGLSLVSMLALVIAPHRVGLGF